LDHLFTVRKEGGGRMVMREERETVGNEGREKVLKKKGWGEGGVGLGGPQQIFRTNVIRRPGCGLGGLIMWGGRCMCTMGGEEGIHVNKVSKHVRGEGGGARWSP